MVNSPSVTTFTKVDYLKVENYINVHYKSEDKKHLKQQLIQSLDLLNADTSTLEDKSSVNKSKKRNSVNTLELTDVKDVEKSQQTRGFTKDVRPKDSPILSRCKSLQELS